MQPESDRSREAAARMDRHLSMNYCQAAKYYWIFLGAVAAFILIFIFASNFLKVPSFISITISAVIVVLYLSLSYLCRPRHANRDGSDYLLPVVASPQAQSQTPSMRREAAELSRIIDSVIPAFLYNRKIGDETSGGASSCQVICSVCLALLLKGEQVRQLPECRHIFHAACIATWLPFHMTCPICRSEIDMTKYAQAAEEHKSSETTEPSAQACSLPA